MHRQLLSLCLNSHSHAPVTSETIRKCIIQLVCLLVSRIHLSNLLFLLLGSTCFYEKMSLGNKKL